MKAIKIYLGIFFFVSILSATAQIETPVRWAYGKKEINANTYEVHLKAILNKGWHVYAQRQPKNSVSVPTSFKFNTTDGFELIGKANETGKLIRYSDTSSGLAANQYANSVDFVQLIKIKINSLHKISGTITFQVCTDHMCLQPDKVDFTIPLK